MDEHILYQNYCKLQADGVSSVEIVVLYPPSSPFIEGQASILYGEPLIFTCNSKGHPPPTFQWLANHLVFSRNQTLTLTASQYRVGVVCRVQNTMLPSYDVPKSSAYDIGKYINVSHPAVIKKLPYSQNVEVGESVNVTCETYGAPAPAVWWSKVGNESFVMFGPYLYVRYVQISFAGHYMCNIENVVIPTNNSKTTTRDSKSVHIVVTDPSSPLPCPDHCQAPAAASTDPPCSNTGEEDGPYTEFLIVTTIVICLLLVANISLYLLHRRKDISGESKRDHELNQTNVNQNEQLSNQSVTTHYDIGRVPETTVSPGVSHPEDAPSPRGGESDRHSYEHPYSTLNPSN